MLRSSRWQWRPTCASSSASSETPGGAPCRGVLERTEVGWPGCEDRSSGAAAHHPPSAPGHGSASRTSSGAPANTQQLGRALPSAASSSSQAGRCTRAAVLATSLRPATLWQARQGGPDRPREASPGTRPSGHDGFFGTHCAGEAQEASVRPQSTWTRRLDCAGRVRPGLLACRVRRPAVGPTVPYADKRPRTPFGADTPGGRRRRPGAAGTGATARLHCRATSPAAHHTGRRDTCGTVCRLRGAHWFSHGQALTGFGTTVHFVRPLRAPRCLQLWPRPPHARAPRGRARPNRPSLTCENRCRPRRALAVAGAGAAGRQSVRSLGS